MTYDHNTYRARLIRVRDGDTALLAIEHDLPEPFSFTVAAPRVVRLAGIDTPERGQPGYAEAKKALYFMLANWNVIARSAFAAGKSMESFGRWLAVVWTNESAESPTLDDKHVARVLLIAFCIDDVPKDSFAKAMQQVQRGLKKDVE